MTSSSSRRPIGTGAWFRAAREAEYPTKCLSVAAMPRALEARHVRRTDRADDVRILADRLLDPPPPVVLDDVHDRRKTLMDADGPHVLADRLRHLADQLGVERGAPGDGRRVHGRVEEQ